MIKENSSCWPKLLPTVSIQYFLMTIGVFNQLFDEVSYPEDNIATGSSYQYVDWSKPSKDGWMAVPNPHLKMFSQVFSYI